MAGVLGNGLVLFVFTRFRRLRGPASSFIVNLAVADLCNSLLHSMAAASSFRKSWAFGGAGCVVYACGVGYFGLLSIVTLAAIAVERYMVITAKPLSGNWKMTQYGARKVCVVIWFYCALMSGPPLFGWSRYVAEGFLTSCSWDYLSRNPANRAYYVYLLTLGFVVPVCVIAYCYAFILAAIRAHGKEMAAVKGMIAGGSSPPIGNISGGGIGVSCRSHYYYHANHHHSPHLHCQTHRSGHRHASSNTSATPTTSHTNHHRSASHRSGARSSNAVRTAEVILTLVLLFLISWTPYSIVSMIGQFGDIQRLTPWAATLPAIFAKASVIYNPIVYGLSHPHFRSSVRQYLSACTTAASAGHGTTASFMRRQSPQAPLKKRAEAAATIAEVASPEPSVASAPPAAVIIGDCDGDPEVKRRMMAEILRSKHRRYKKHRSGSPAPLPCTGRLHHVHFRYHSGEFLSEPDSHQVTLLIDKPREGELEWCTNGAVSCGARRLTVSHGGDDRDRLNREEMLSELRAARRPSCSRAVCVVYEGSHVCCLAGREAGSVPAKNKEAPSASKSLWEVNSFL